MNRPSFFSVAGRVSRAASISLITLATLACTIQHTRDTARTTLEELGLRSSVNVNRTGFWAIPGDTKIFLSRTAVSGDLNSAFPRLRTRLDELLAAAVQERFPLVQRQSDELPVTSALIIARELGCDLLLYLNLRQVDDPMSDTNARRGGSENRLSLVMYVMDVRTGRLLDRVAAQGNSGWLRWGEHQLVELAEPSVQAVVSQLLAREAAALAR